MKPQQEQSTLPDWMKPVIDRISATFKVPAAIVISLMTHDNVFKKFDPEPVISKVAKKFRSSLDAHNGSLSDALADYAVSSGKVQKIGNTPNMDQARQFATSVVRMSTPMLRNGVQNGYYPYNPPYANEYKPAGPKPEFTYDQAGVPDEFQRTLPQQRYEVQPGDTERGMELKYGVSMPQIYQNNVDEFDQNNNQFKPGMKLKVPIYVA